MFLHLMGEDECYSAAVINNTFVIMELSLFLFIILYIKGMF